MSHAGRSADRFFAVVLFVLIGVLAWEFYSSFIRNQWDPAHGRRGSDFSAFYSAGELAWRGENIYDFEKSSTARRAFLYPPPFAVFPMAPLSLLPHDSALVIFLILNVVMAVAVFWMLRRMLWPDSAEPPVSFWRDPRFGILLTVLLCYRFFQQTLRLGNVNIIICFLIVAALFLALRHRLFRAGLLVALATAIKVTPGLLGLFLIWSRRVRAAAGGAVGLIVFLLLLPVPLLGFAGNLKLLEAFIHHAGTSVSTGGESEGEADIVGYADPNRKEYEGGDSLRGMARRLLTPHEVRVRHKNNTEIIRINVVTLEPAMARRIADGVALMLLAITVLLTAPRWVWESTDTLALAWGLTATLMLLISPLTRTAHLTVLCLPIATLLSLLQRNRLSGMARTAAYAGLGAMGLCGLVIAEVIGRKASDIINNASATTVGMLALFAGTAVVLRSIRPNCGVVARAALRRAT